MTQILTVIFNHNCNQGAIGLKQQLGPYFDPILIDSGSQFKEGEEEHFDLTFPNIYYNGLINKAYELLTANHTHLFIITSDVDIPNPEMLRDRMMDILKQPSVGVYAPSVIHTTHNHMHNRKSKGVRRVTFTDGFCYAIPKEFLKDICPIDLAINRIGHATDMYMGYLGMIYKRYAVVDDMMTVDHPKGSGYSSSEARIQRDNWFKTKSKKARFYHYWVTMDWLKNKVGFYLMFFLMKVIGQGKP